MNSLKNHYLIATTLVCMLPIILALIIYNQLPEQLPVHWNAAGEIDRYMSKPLVVFGLPIFFSVLNIIVILGIKNDPKKQNQSKFMKLLGIWTIPVLSLILMSITFLVSMGADISVPLIVSLIMGILFIIVGNYLPKSRQNYTIGIRLPWTLNSADNWNKTHRVGGICFILGGIIILVSSLVYLTHNIATTHAVITAIVILLTVVIPTAYSFVLYRINKR